MEINVQQTAKTKDLGHASEKFCQNTEPNALMGSPELVALSEGGKVLNDSQRTKEDVKTRSRVFTTNLIDFLAYMLSGCALIYFMLGRASPLSPYWLIFGGPIFVGLAAYRLRCTHRSAFGLAEIIIGALLGSSIFLGRPPEVVQTTFAFVGAAYIIVRGLDNIRSGMFEKTRRRWDSFFEY